MIDPLTAFLNEKVAAESDDAGGGYKIPIHTSRTAEDPGERAMAGLAAVSSSIAPWAAGTLARMAASSAIDKGAVPWESWPIQGVKSIEEALSTSIAQSPKTRMLGLFDIKGRPRGLPQSQAEAIRIDKMYDGKMREIQPVVDSFIDKHNLKKKGVRINIQKGPLTGRSGGAFELPTKEVYLPTLSKEHALHELGHAADYTKGLGKIRRWAEPILKKSVLTALPIAMIAGDRIKEMIPGTIDDKAINFMQENAPEIMAATLAATTLIPEAKASFLAVKHIKELEKAGKQPVGAAMAAAKKLAPSWGTYLVGAIPAIVGMALARKYMRQARKEKEEGGLEKEGGVGSALGSIGRTIATDLGDVAYVAKQIGKETKNLLKDDGTLKRLARAAKETGQSPEFIWGSMASAIPATMGALYMYGTPGGKEIRGRLEHEDQKAMLGHGRKELILTRNADAEWKERNPLRFAGLVAAGAALSGGIISKFMSDLTRVL